MFLMVTGLYIACLIAFYVQMLLQSRFHADLDAETQPHPEPAAEVIELFPPANQRKSA